jgi:hypothetical protein
MPGMYQGDHIVTGVNAAGVIRASPGRLVRIIITTAGSAATLTVNDNASAASGAVLFAAPGNAAQGSIYLIDEPCENGIYLTPGTGQVLNVTHSDSPS